MITNSDIKEIFAPLASQRNKIKVLNTKCWTSGRRVMFKIEFIDIFNKVRHVTGVAKCDSRDKYDFVFGKKLASARAQHDMYCMVYRDIFYINSVCRDLSEQMRQKLKKYYKAAMNEASYETYLLYGEAKKD